MNLDSFQNYLLSKSCVFWDWNGTLLNDLDYSLGITNEILGLKSSATLSKQFYQEHFTIPIKDYYDKVGMFNTGFTFDELTDHYISRYQAGRHVPELYSGAKNCLNKLGDKGLSQVLFSAAHISELEFQVKHHGLTEVFEIMSGSGDFYGGCKLERGQALKNEYGFKNGVLVGDTLHDVEIGKEIGFETVWVSEGHQSIERAEGHRAVDYILNRSLERFYKNSN
jgi:phosphoglycolate phosphatase